MEHRRRKSSLVATVMFLIINHETSIKHTTLIRGTISRNVVKFTKHMFVGLCTASLLVNIILQLTKAITLFLSNYCNISRNSLTFMPKFGRFLIPDSLTFTTLPSMNKLFYHNCLQNWAFPQRVHQKMNRKYMAENINFEF